MQFAEGLHRREVREIAATQAQQLLDRSVAEVRAMAPDLEVEGWLDVGHVSGVLVERSQEADLLVIGTPSHHHGVGRLLGTTTGHLVSHARCSLAVVPELVTQELDPVLVGVDDAASAKAVLAAAFGEAELRGVGVHALHAFEWPVSLGPDDWVTPLYTGDSLREAEELLLAEALEGAKGDFPAVPVRSTVVNASAPEALLKHAHSSSLLVVGSRGRGGFTGMLLGSVARSVAFHAACPTLLVRV